MYFISDPSHSSLSQAFAKRLKIPAISPEIHRFPDGETRVRIAEDIASKKVILLKSICPPVNDHVMELALVLDSLQRSGASEIHAIIPYLGYSRALHQFRTGESVGLDIVRKILESFHISTFVFVDLHSIKIKELFTTPIEEVSILPLFAKTIRSLVDDLLSVTLVSPDKGGLRRVEMLSSLLAKPSVVAIDKTRDLSSGDIKLGDMRGKLNETCFVIDDMISTGGTMVEAINYLANHKVKKIYAMATHPVLSGKASHLLQDSPVEKVFVADTIEIEDSKKFPKLEILSIAGELAKSAKSWLK